ncbi:MAG: triose-phosphate isomerase, partial [Pseudomonadota bacterium]
MVEKIAAGNWKMNGSRSALAELNGIAQAAQGADCTTVICPPFPYVGSACATPSIAIGGQDCHAATAGAHTGDTSAAMLADLGASFVILGHSERRADHGETSVGVAAKVSAAQSAGLRPIVCVGETLDDREAGKTLAVVTDQLIGSLDGASADGLVVAYEPVWAIGTGKTATPDLIADVHTDLRKR